MSKKLLRASVALALAGNLFGGVALAQTGPAKVDYLTGGVSVGEREVLAGRGKEFNLKVVTAAERSGAYLADVRMKVIDARDAKVLLETKMDGPWFLARLPPGKYVLEATYGGKTLAKTVAIPEEGQREAYFYWAVADLRELEGPEAPKR
jgi:hypothetical protein